MSHCKWIAGIDGCKNGWFAVLWDGENCFKYMVCSTFKDVLQIKPEPAIIAIDMPIGLLAQPQKGGRVCDREARKLLGYPRRNNIFSPPERYTLWNATDFENAKNLNKPAGLTKQSFVLFPKLKEVDEVIEQ